MKHIKTAVIILNWNGLAFLEKFLPVVLECTGNDAEVIVADNASTDRSVELMRTQFPQVRLILHDENYGFAKGYNVALKQIDADYYVLLNSDVEVTCGWIPPIINLMEEDHSIAACQPKLLSYHNRRKFEYSGAAGGFIDKLGYPFCRGRLFQTMEYDHGQYDDIEEVFWASGAAMFVRASSFWEIQGFDNDFFAHMEEIDLCWRLKNNGYRIMYCGRSVIYHVGGGTLPKSSARKTYLNIRNNLFMLYKNLPKEQLWPTLRKRVFLDAIASVRFLFDGGGIKSFGAVIRAHTHFWKGIKRLEVKRNRYIRQKRVSRVYRGVLVYDYYIFQKKYFFQLLKKRFS